MGEPRRCFQLLERIGTYHKILAGTPRAVAAFEQALAIDEPSWSAASRDRARLHRLAALTLLPVALGVRLTQERPDEAQAFYRRRPAAILGYKESWLDHVPEESLASFAGTGNPFSLGELQPGERVVDIACGVGNDSFIAAHMVGPEGMWSGWIRPSK